MEDWEEQFKKTMAIYTENQTSGAGTEKPDKKKEIKKKVHKPRVQITPYDKKRAGEGFYENNSSMSTKKGRVE